jgi:UDP-N-acetylmuramate-alanine ligase
VPTLLADLVNGDDIVVTQGAGDIARWRASCETGWTPDA